MKSRIIALSAALLTALSAWALTPAEFPGGAAAQAEYIATNLKYPKTAKDNGIEGVVNVTFTVKPDGTVGNIKVIRMIDPDLEAEAIRLVKTMPAWTPATDAGAPVESTASMAIAFEL